MSQVQVILEDRDLKCLAELREQLKNEQSLEYFEIFLDDNFLLRFIRGRKYKVDYALETIKCYFQVRLDKYPDLFLALLPSKIKLSKDNCVLPLKNFGPGGHYIMYSRVDWWPPHSRIVAENLHFDDALHRLLMVFEEMWKIPSVSLNGFEAIFDAANVSFEQMKWAICQIRYYMMGINIAHRGLPLRVKKIHLINPPKYLNILIKLLLPLDPAGYFKKLHIHHGKKLKTLHKHLPQEILPHCLSGQLPDDQAFDEDFYTRSLQNDPVFEKLHQCIRKGRTTTIQTE